MIDFLQKFGTAVFVFGWWLLLFILLGYYIAAFFTHSTTDIEVIKNIALYWMFVSSSGMILFLISFIFRK